jgi:ferredoxin-type protein NapF
MDASRRGFFRGRRQAASIAAPLRPPWALGEAAFITACTRCGACVEKCPNGIVVAGSGSFPTVDFSRGECSFCGDCVTACAEGALSQKAQQEAWQLAPVIATTCIAQQNVVCRTCGDSCEPRAIRFRPRLGAAAVPEIETTDCTGCGACVAICPVQSIHMESLHTNHAAGTRHAMQSTQQQGAVT